MPLKEGEYAQPVMFTGRSHCGRPLFQGPVKALALSISTVVGIPVRLGSIQSFTPVTVEIS
jgi:hypothetical protein